MLLVMNFTLVYAGDPRSPITKADLKTDNISPNKIDLAPVTPPEAFFDDTESLPVTDISRLAPITPKEATFEEYNADILIPIPGTVTSKKLAPETPGEAGFDDELPLLGSGIESLAPLSFKIASFED